MLISRVNSLSDLKSAPNDYNLLYRIAVETELFSQWLDNEHYRYLSNFLKYRIGIVVRQGYVFCNNSFALKLVIEFTSVSCDNVVLKKGLF